MTREEIENIPETVNYLLDESVLEQTRRKLNEKLKEMCDFAIKALEQEPKIVLYSGDGYADGYMVYDMAECPSCGYEYEYGDKDWEEPFCPHCGQPLKWESEETV